MSDEADCPAEEPAEFPAEEPVEGEVVDAEFTVVDEAHELGELEREHYEAIKDANNSVRLAQYEYDIANAEAKSLKKEVENASLRLTNLIAEGVRKPDPQKTLPFTDAEQQEAAGDCKPNWAETPISEAINMTEKQQEKLESAGIQTVGEFEHVRGCNDRNYPDGLRSIKGVGEKTVDKWENEVLDWLALNTREPEPAEPAGEPEGEPAENPFAQVS